MLSEVVCAYASYLATQPDCLNLVPAYLCHLQLTQRRQLTVQLLATALDMGGMEEGQVCSVLRVGVGGGGVVGAGGWVGVGGGE